MKKKELLLVSPPENMSSHSMKIYRNHIQESCQKLFKISGFKWNEIYRSQHSLQYRFFKYIKSRNSLYKYGRPYLQHITDQSFAHLYNKNAQYNILTVHDINPIVLYKEKLDNKNIPPLLFRYTTFFYKKFNRIITPSNATKNYLKKYINIDEDKIVVVNNAVELSPKSYRKFEGINILMIGDTHTKNIKRSFDAIKNFIRLKNIDVTIHWITGSHTSEGIKNSLKNSKLRINLYKDIDHKKVVELYGRSSVLLFPSLVEGFGYPIIEAMRQKLPVITSNTGATNEIAQGFCYLVSPDSTSSILGGLFKFYDERGDKQLKMLDSAFKHSLNFNLVKFQSNILKSYEHF